MSAEQLKLGLIGVGDILEAHLGACRANPEFKLMGICRRSADKLKAQATKLGVKGYSDYRDMLEDRPGVVLVSLPHNLHYPVARDAIEAGCHVLIEKPLAISMTEINELIRMSRSGERAIMVTENSYWLANFRRAGEIVRSGKLGEFLFGNFANHRFYFTDARPRWFLKSETSGGGQFTNIGVHRIAAVRCILGDDLEEAMVTASVHRIHPQYDIEAATKAMVSYQGGQAMSYEECGYFEPPDPLPRGLHFVFEKGLLGVAGNGVWTSDKDGRVTEHELPNEPPGGAYGALYGQMLKAIRGEEHYPTVRHGAKDVRVALAAYASAEQHATIDLRQKNWLID